MTLISVNSIPWIAGLAALFASAATDLKSRYIPNEMAALVAVSGLTIGLISRPGQVWLSLLVAIAVMLALGALARRRMMGGGDVKLISAATLLVAPERVGILLLAIALAGGLLSSVYLGGRVALSRLPAPAGKPKPGVARNHVLYRFLRNERARIAAGRSMPYGVAIFAGVATYAASEGLRCFYATS